MTGLYSHGTKWGMKSLLFVLSLVASSVAYSAQPVSGTVDRTSAGLFLRVPEKAHHCDRLLIHAKTDEAVQSLKKLDTGDTITAAGFFAYESCSVFIDSVDYVGLKRLLGHWHSSDGIISVQDFDSLSFYPINLKDLTKGGVYEKIEPIRYRYSLTPSEGTEWVLFLSDSTSTTFATLQFSKSSAIMKIYDSDTGAIKKTLRMSKWSPQNK